MRRIHAMDYFRGVMALSVLVYHYFSWSVAVPGSDSVLGRLGIYAVSSFYIISGMSLYLVYRKGQWGVSELWSFSLKRFLRLAPAYWLATGLVTFLAIMSDGPFAPDWPKYLANLTLSFGLYSPGEYIPVGGWSIGNEVAFYVFFPFLMLCSLRTWSFISALGVLFSGYVYYSFSAMTAENTLAEQWDIYILPFNQAFLFASGVAVAWVKDRWCGPGSRLSILILLLSIGMFVIYPAAGDKINIVTGPERLIFTTICIAACFSLLGLPELRIKWLSRPLGFLGDTSYTIYMLHGVSAAYAMRYVEPILGIDTPTEKLLFLLLGVLPFVLVSSFFVYRYLEMNFIQLGKNWSAAYTKRRPKDGPASARRF